MKLMMDSLGELKKGAWSPEEDQRLIAYVEKHGSKNWCQMPRAAGLARSGKSCRLRWVNYLRPDLKRGRLTVDEIETINKLQKSIGNKWTKIAEHLPGRTDNEIKNFWYLNMKKYSQPMPKKNPPIKSNKTKRENRKVSSYASDEVYSSEIINSSPSSSIITQSMDFPIVESYSSSSKDYLSQGQIQVEYMFGEPFWSELQINVEDQCTATHRDEIDSLHSKSASEFDESTSFWFNVLMDAERLRGK